MVEHGKVFISYAREDIRAAHQVYLELKREGLKPWMDTPPSPYEFAGLLPGEDWKARLSREIETSQFLIAILSSESVMKRGYVQREYRLALDMMNEIPSGDLFLFPLLLDDCEVPDLRVGAISLHDLNWQHYEVGGLRPIVMSMRRIIARSLVPKDGELVVRKPLLVEAPAKAEVGDGKQAKDSTTSCQGSGILWSTFVGQQKWKNTPIFVDDLVIVGSAGLAWNTPDELDGFYGLHKATGETIWRVPTLSDANEIVRHGNFLYGGTDGGELVCIEASTGRVVWCRTFPGEFHAPFQIARTENDEVLILAVDLYGHILLLEPERGDLLSSELLKENFRSAPVCVGTAGAEYVIASQSGVLFHIDIRRRKVQVSELFQVDFPDHFSHANKSRAQIYSTPVLSDGKLFLGYSRPTYYPFPAIVCFDLDERRICWEPSSNRYNKTFGNIRSNLLLLDDLLWVGGAYSNELQAFDMICGNLVKAIPLGETRFAQWCSAAADGRGNIYLPRNDGYLYAVDSQAGKMKGQVFLGFHDMAGCTDDSARSPSRTSGWSQVFFSSPAIDNNLVYMGTDEGYLYCVKDLVPFED